MLISNEKKQSAQQQPFKELSKYLKKKQQQQQKEQKEEQEQARSRSSKTTRPPPQRGKKKKDQQEQKTAKKKTPLIGTPKIVVHHLPFWQPPCACRSGETLLNEWKTEFRNDLASLRDKAHAMLQSPVIARDPLFPLAHPQPIRDPFWNQASTHPLPSVMDNTIATHAPAIESLHTALLFYLHRMSDPSLDTQTRHRARLAYNILCLRPLSCAAVHAVYPISRPPIVFSPDHFPPSFLTACPSCGASGNASTRLQSFSPAAVLGVSLPPPPPPPPPSALPLPPPPPLAQSVSDNEGTDADTPVDSPLRCAENAMLLPPPTTPPPAISRTIRSEPPPALLLSPAKEPLLSLFPQASPGRVHGSSVQLFSS